MSSNWIQYGEQLVEGGWISFLITSFLLLFIAVICSKLLKKVIERKKRPNEKILLRFKNIVIYAFTFYSILMQIIPFQRFGSTLLASSGIVAVVLGLAAQEALGNFVNGMLIMIFKPFRIGDFIKVNNDEYSGTVLDISLRHTIIKTLEGTQIIIPNSEMNKAVLENVSRLEQGKGQFLQIGIAYESDIKQAIHIIEESIRNHPNFIDTRSKDEIYHGVKDINVRLIDFQDSCMLLKTQVIAKDNITGYAMLSDLRITIKEKFDEAGIIIPYPQRVIHIANNPTEEKR